ncbi:hypothetical protein [Deinococcus sonorensis]|uniref:Uncharacterized protein n=2 Tax=Deinococcus sonorensis TaxID=309891 RepID=A0AAU7U6C2_9DEIO
MHESARTSAVALKLEYEYMADAGRDLRGYTRTLQEAQEACAEACGGQLAWAASGRASWAACDARTGIRYRVERLQS